jgi:hypothetical protein
MAQPPIQGAFEQHLEELGQVERVEDFLRDAQREALQRHRRAIERRMPEEIWEQIEEHEGMDEGPHEVPRINPQTRGRMERPSLRNMRELLSDTQQRFEARRTQALLRGEPLAPIEERTREEYRRSAATAVQFRRPEWSQRQVEQAARRIATGWDPNRRGVGAQTAFHDRLLRLLGY